MSGGKLFAGGAPDVRVGGESTLAAVPAQPLRSVKASAPQHCCPLYPNEQISEKGLCVQAWYSS
jgi:hypothetical protein